MSGEAFLKVIGRERLERILLAIPDLLRRKFLRPALRAGAQVVLAAVYAKTPVLRAPVFRDGKMIRKPGTIRDHLAVRNSKDATRAGDVGVFVNVRPAKAGERGARSPNDPYYWRWVTFRTRRNQNPREFMQAGAAQLEGAALRAIEANLAPRIQALDNGDLK
jgi:hypothetical protein